MRVNWTTLCIATLTVALVAAYLSAQHRPATATTGRAPAGAPAAPAAPRIGTYDGRAVALAYYRSDAALAEINALVDEARKAKAANDPRAPELEQTIRRLSMRNHAQVFSNLPAGDVVQKHVGEPALRDIARAAGVQAIVPSVEWRDQSVEAVDLTDALVERFRPTDKTRAYAREIRSKPPIDVWDVAHDKH
jgi:hypothetical protein